MKRIYEYLSIIYVIFITIYAFINMHLISDISLKIINLMINNLIPSLLPFMILISLCLQLNIINILNYLLQRPFYYLFSLTPMMSSIYFISFFCGYPTNVKLIKEAYELNYLTHKQLVHLLDITSFSSLSFIFISLNSNYSLIIYLAHIIPSIIYALFYQDKKQYQSISQTFNFNKISFIKAFKNSITSSITTFIYIFGYMFLFQITYYFINNIFKIDSFIIRGLLEFSSGCLLINDSIVYIPYICFFLSFSSLSIMMQINSILEDIDYSFIRYFIVRCLHGIISFIIAYMLI